MVEISYNVLTDDPTKKLMLKLFFSMLWTRGHQKNFFSTWVGFFFKDFGVWTLNQPTYVIMHVTKRDL